MFIVIVHVSVKDDCIPDFIRETNLNASASLEEAGISFFDVIQHNDEPAKFLLMEVYKDEAASKAHKETAHYQKWRDAVADMMKEPRYSEKYHEIFPALEFWQKPA
jgi:autoinducer 2-degrading protein